MQGPEPRREHQGVNADARAVGAKHRHAPCESLRKVGKMKPRHYAASAGVLLAAVCVWAVSAGAQETPGSPAAARGGAEATTSAAGIPETKIAALAAELAGKEQGASPARRRRAVKKMIREGESLLEAYPAASNRYRLLGVLFRAWQEVCGLDKSAENRAALLQTCRQLAEAPDEYASVRLDADLLVSQTSLARQGATPIERAEALKALVVRYRDTAVETKMLKIATLMALELGDADLVGDLRRIMAERFAGNLELIAFQRDKLGGQVFGAPFCGAYTCPDGTVHRFPMDCLGQPTLLYFWSKETGQDDLEQLAAAWREAKDEIAGRIRIVSFNLDELPDAGEKILRGLGVDWPALRLPGGRKSPVYRAYARTDPRVVVVSGTGYAALVLAGNRGMRNSGRDYPRTFGSLLARSWSKPRYLSQLRSLFVGEFLIVHPYETFNPACPPELQAIAGWDSGKKAGASLSRTAASVPERDLRAIQACFPAPPGRYRLTYIQAWANYRKADTLCRAAIERCPRAPDLWIVYNREIIALLGMWKLTCEPKYLESAVQEAKASLALDPPPGADVVPRFCLAMDALRRDDAGIEAVLAAFLASAGGERAPGPAFAAAAVLALNAGDRMRYTRYRRAILDRDTEEPMMWTMVSFLLDRQHRYELFRAPYSAGWSFGRRWGRYLGNGEPQDANRILRADLKTLDGKAFRIPRDTAGKWTAILFSPPWEGEKAFPYGRLKAESDYAAKRGLDDINTIVAVPDKNVARVRTLAGEDPADCQTVVVPDGVRNRLVHRLGLLAPDEQPSVIVLRPDGVIAAALPGAAPGGRLPRGFVRNVIEWHDEKAVDEALKNGNLEEAKRLALKLAPTEKPAPAVGKRVKKSDTAISLPHLRSRAKVYMALKDWKAALADVEEVVARQRRADAGLAVRSPEFVQAMRWRADILDALGQR